MSSTQVKPVIVPVFALIASLLGCAVDDTGGESVSSVDAGGVLDTGIGPIVAGDSGSAVIGGGSAFPPPTWAADSGPGVIVLGGADAGPPSSDGGAIIIAIPTRSVACGGTECMTTNNRTCCQAWSRGVGFEGAPTCTTKATCETDHAPIDGDTNRAIVSDCDERADCGAGQACCFVRYGRGIRADLFNEELVGPGASRMCMNLSSCNAGTMTFSGVLGTPLGLVACKTNADCSDGASCVPEAANSASTGKDSPARPGVMLCQ